MPFVRIASATFVFYFTGASCESRTFFTYKKISNKTIITMNKHLFYSFRTWRICMGEGFKQFGWGLWRIVSGSFLGIASVFAYVGRQIEAFCRREPIAATIIALTFSAMAAGWLYTFVNGRARTAMAQHAADSLSYSLELLTQSYDSVIVDGDTIKFSK